jgi:hypothetical protein
MNTALVFTTVVALLACVSSDHVEKKQEGKYHGTQTTGDIFKIILNYFTCKSDSQVTIQPARFQTSLDMETVSFLLSPCFISHISNWIYTEPVFEHGSVMQISFLHFQRNPHDIGDSKAKFTYFIKLKPVDI